MHIEPYPNCGQNCATTAAKYAGSGWIFTMRREVPLSPLGIAVADLLGDVFQGIYHLEKKHLLEARWDDPHCVQVKINASLCTVDFDHLTRLVVLGHDRMLRCEIKGWYRGCILLTFHQRNTRSGHAWERHPTLEEHVAAIRSHYGIQP